MTNKQSVSLKLAKEFLGEIVQIKIDRPYMSKHPKWGFEYKCNYGYVEGVLAPDGEELDAYLLLVDQPVSSYEGRVVAIIHRTSDDDDKLVVIPNDKKIDKDTIEGIVSFQEQFFEHTIIMNGEEK